MKVVTSFTTASAPKAVSSPQAGSGWLWVLILAVAGSVVSLLSGLGISLLTVTGVIPASRAVAYLTIALLLGFFVLFFVAAHSMDRFAARKRAARVEKCRRTGLEDDTFKAN